MQEQGRVPEQAVGAGGRKVKEFRSGGSGDEGEHSLALCPLEATSPTTLSWLPQREDLLLRQPHSPGLALELPLPQLWYHCCSHMARGWG